MKEEEREEERKDEERRESERMWEVRGEWRGTEGEEGRREREERG